jgi:hypothetical protein
MSMSREKRVFNELERWTFVGLNSPSALIRSNLIIGLGVVGGDVVGSDDV